MSDTRTARLAEIRARCEAAQQMVSDLCKGIRRWTLSVPVRQNDPDIMLVNSLNDIPWLLDDLDAARFAPLGDNHHNAALCPYCQPELQKQIDAARRTALLEAAEVAENHGTQHSFESCSRIIATELRRRAEEKQP